MEKETKEEGVEKEKKIKRLLVDNIYKTGNLDEWIEHLDSAVSCIIDANCDLEESKCRLIPSNVLYNIRALYEAFRDAKEYADIFDAKE